VVRWLRINEAGEAERGVVDEPASMQCREILDLLADYLEGSLPSETARALETHLEGCGPCIAFVNTYRGTINAAGKIREVEIPPELEARLLSFLRRKKP
jgi:epoxyqueuosine reductase QueG